MRRFVPFALVLVVGVVLGWLTHALDRSLWPRSTPHQLVPYAGPICVRQVEDNVAVNLTPHHVWTRDRDAILAPCPEGVKIWTITLDDGRVIIACTEDRVVASAESPL